MPRAKSPKAGALLDSWVRGGNRKHTDKTCPQCGASFKPYRATSSYCSRPCARKKNGGHNRKPESWWIDQRGYVQGRIEVNGEKVRIKKHRLVAAEMIGRPLAANEDVHHINGNRLDNRPENLAVISHGEHSRHHNKERKHKRGYKLNLSVDERKARSDRMRAQRRAAIAKAEAA